MNKIENILALTITVIFMVTGIFLVQEEGVPLPSEPRLEINFLDVGQGDAILLELGNEQILIDGGPDDSILAELGKVMPATDRKIETIILTHPHADHLRGLKYVLRSYQVNQVYFNGVSYSTPEFEGFLATIQEEKIPTERLFAGKTLQFKALTLRTLWPTETLPPTDDINDTSLILEAAYGATRYLLLADASVKAQAETYEGLGKVNIVKISHHGSKTGTNKDLIELTKPDYAVISVGRNSYGHPSPIVLDLISGSKVLRTDQRGTISFWADETAVYLY